MILRGRLINAPPGVNLFYLPGCQHRSCEKQEDFSGTICQLIIPELSSGIGFTVMVAPWRPLPSIALAVITQLFTVMDSTYLVA